MEPERIENHGVIGDLHTIALVAMDGTIDFMAFPRFDAPTLFAGLLDARRGGHFALAPVGDAGRRKQLYLPDTNVLLTRFASRRGVAEISDFMPLPDEHGCRGLVRRAKCVRGDIPFRMVLEPRFDYGRIEPRMESESDRGILIHSGGPDGLAMRLRTSVPVRVNGSTATAEFTLHPGQTAAFTLERAGPGGGSPCFADPGFVSRSFRETVNFWRRWVGRSRYRGRWREMVNRSALTLKLLTSEEFGSIVAAPTFGLPEEWGGERNWDYRYTWVRDASFTLYALSRLGYTEEAAAFMRWIEERCANLNPDGSLQVMYGVDGRRELTEEELPHLAGYGGARPVRIGNGAWDQLQLDIYGELMDSVYLYDKYGSPLSYDLWQNLVRLIDWVCAHWQEPDEGIWEVRGGRREFLSSRLMCWVALDRGVRLALRRSFPAPHERWLRVRNEIYLDIFERFWDPGRGAFVQYRGASCLDASCLLMPLVRFVGPTDPRWLSTLRGIEEELVDDSLVRRYRVERTGDGLAGGEGTFSMCTFWYVECLSRAGDVEKARFFFEKMLGYANHLGLYAEELSAQGEHLGNFPQAFAHIGLISAAYELDRRLSERERGG